MDRTALGFVLLVIALFMLTQPGLPTANAHEGHSDTGGSEDAPGDGFHANASLLVPYEPYIRQQNPAMHGSMVVWEETQIGRPTDIVAYNVSTDEGPFPVSTRAIHEKNPTVQGPWIAWEQHHEGDNATIDIAVYDTRTGTLVTIPDNGNDQQRPAIGRNGTVYYAERHGEDERLRAFDLLTRTTWKPIGDTKILAGPSIHGHHLAWAELSPANARIVTLDTQTNTKETVPNRWDLRDGPVMGPHGVTFIATHPGRQGGTYATTYSEELGLHPHRSGVYPHDNVDHCENGIVWDQPGTAVSDFDHISSWDPYTEKRTHLGTNNTNPACGASHLVYEKPVARDDEDTVPRLYIVGFRELRLSVDADIRMDPGLERSIITEPTTFTGTIQPGDPRETVETVLGRVDNGPVRTLSAEPLPDGGVRWSMTVDPRDYPSGLRTLQVAVDDSMGTRTNAAFAVFTDTPYALDANRLDRDLDVPRTDPSPFPFNILDHYKAYQPFYNTIILLIVLIVVAVIGVHRYRTNKPPEPPSYVPPQDPNWADDP